MADNNVRHPWAHLLEMVPLPVGRDDGQHVCMLPLIQQPLTVPVLCSPPIRCAGRSATAKAGAEFNFRQLADIKDEALLQQVCAASDASHDISLPVMGCIILTI